MTKYVDDAAKRIETGEFRKTIAQKLKPQRQPAPVLRVEFDPLIWGCPKVWVE